MNANNENRSMTATAGAADLQGFLDELLLNAVVRAKLKKAVQGWLDGRSGMADVRRLLVVLKRDGSLNEQQYADVLAMMESQVSNDSKTNPGVTPYAAGDSTDPFGHTMVLPGKSAGSASDEGGKLEIGTVLRDRFLLQEHVAGGMGSVYKALDRRLAEVEGVEPWVAIKVLSPRMSNDIHALRALKQEAAKGRCLTHPNIVRFVDLDRQGDVYFIVMEWIHGQSLASLLDSGEQQPGLTESLDIIRQTGEALDYAHRCGVVHADVKPGNIMLTPSGVVKLIDFGIAHVRQHQLEQGHYNVNIMRAATPAYSSMQVLTGEDPVPADDVFSLGCLAYRLIAGHRVFGPRNAAEAAEAGMEPQRPVNLSDNRWKALRKALAHSRVARYSTPKAFVQDLTKPPADMEFAEPPSIRAEATDERRIDSRTSSWPYALLPMLVAAAAIAFVRPAWITESMAIVQQWLASHDLISETVAVRDQQAAPASTTAAAPPPLEEAIADTGSGDDPPDATLQDTGLTPGETANPADTAQARESAVPEDAELPDDSASDGAPLSDPTGTTVTGLSATAEDATSSESVAPTPAMGSTVAAGTSIVLAAPGEERPEIDLAIDEGGSDAVIEVYRWFGLNEPLTVRVDEVGYSGNQSPRETGQYTLSGDGVISFDKDQRQATLGISMSDDNDREPDRQVSLRLRDYYNAGAELAVVNLSLLDDDQRAYEANHAVNTVTFASTQMLVRERDPAVAIDVQRLNPDQNTLMVPYFVESVTATDGQDFFAPGRQMLMFGPGQRTARLLIPLVQDNQTEPDESFLIELQVASGDSDTFPRIEVVIRDDDSIN